MSKYIIEIAKEYEEYFKGVLICGIADEKFAVDVIAREDLEELNSDYINEHYGELQDEAYKRGYEDGKKSQNDDRIEVGDEVATETGKKYTVVSFGDGGTVCGFDKEGVWTGWIPKKVTKTGRHFDIASILEAMRT